MGQFRMPDYSEPVAVDMRAASACPAAPRPGGQTHSDWKMPAAEWWKLTTLVCLAAVAYTAAMAVADPDLWGHTLYGLRAVERGVLLERTDPFSYTAAGSIWINHEWLTEYQFGWIWKRWGNVGLWAWRNAMILVVFAVGVGALHRARANLGTCVLLLAFTALCLAGFVTFIRPQCATFALFAVTLFILRCHWDHPQSKWIWLLPLLSVLWTNLHGGFLAGLAMQAVYASAFGVRAVCEPALRRAAWCLSIVGLLSALATLLNPYGWNLHLMLWHHLIPAQAVREWQPLWAASQAPLYYLPFILVLLGLLGSRRWQWIDLLLILAVSQQAISHIRHVALLAIAVLILLPLPLSDAVGRRFQRLGTALAGASRWRRRLLLTAAAALLLVLLQVPATVAMWQQGVFPWQIAVASRTTAPGVPYRAVSVLSAEDVRGNLVTDYGWAQYAIWHLHPRNRVAFDGRYRTVYPAELEREFLAFQRLDAKGPATTPLLDKYGSELVLLPAASGVCRYLDGRQDWVVVYRDEQAAIYVRRLPKFARVIERAQRGQIASPDLPNWSCFPAGPVARPHRRHDDAWRAPGVAAR